MELPLLGIQGSTFNEHEFQRKSEITNNRLQEERRALAACCPESLRIGSGRFPTLKKSENGKDAGLINLPERTPVEVQITLSETSYPEGRGRGGWAIIKSHG
jgi:hypothetical protein